ATTTLTKGPKTSSCAGYCSAGYRHFPVAVNMSGKLATTLSPTLPRSPTPGVANANMCPATTIAAVSAFAPASGPTRRRLTPTPSPYPALFRSRAARSMGPGVSLQGQLTKGATYQVAVSVRMVDGQPATTILPTFQRTPTGGSAQFDTVMTISNVTDAPWVTA